jgi:hypothetical protein
LVSIGNTLVLTAMALAVALTMNLAPLGQAQGVCSAADRAAGGLANAANGVCRALQGFTEEANDTGHFYSGARNF